jgi:hypothetical protein
MNFNEPWPRRAPYEWALGVKVSAWMKYFFLGWIFLLLLTDLILDLFVHFLIYNKKQLGGIFVKKQRLG